MLSDLVLNNQQLIEREESRFLVSPLGAETVLMDTNNGDYLGINIVGSSIWNLIQSPQSIEQIVAALVQEYEVEEAQCLQEVLVFLEKMEEKKMLKYHSLVG